MSAVDNLQAESLQKDQGMVIVRHPEEARRSREPRFRRLAVWMGAAVLAGSMSGLAALVIVNSHTPTLRLAVPTERIVLTQTVVPVAYQQLTPSRSTGAGHGASPKLRTSQAPTEAALEEVKTRNRRLEALVKVLRRRGANEARSSGSRTN